MSQSNAVKAVAALHESEDKRLEYVYTHQAFLKKCRDGRYGSSVPMLSIRTANHEAARTSDRDTLRI